MEEDTDYIKTQYNLKQNPFGTKSARLNHLSLWVDREKEQEVWESVLYKSVSPLEDHENHLVFIVGSYGRGKTLSLFKILDLAKRYPEIMSVYMNFVPEDKPKPGPEFILRIIKNVDFESIADKKPIKEILQAIESMPNNLNEPKRVIKQIYSAPGLNSTDYISSPGSPSDLLRTNQGLSKTALCFIRGEKKVTETELKQLGIKRKIESVEIAEEYLAGVLSFLYRLGYKTLLIAMDEFEYLFSLIPRSQHGHYVALLRGLYDFPVSLGIDDKSIANMVLMIATSDDGWTRLTKQGDVGSSIGGATIPLLERITATTTLGRLDEKSTKDLIVKRLHLNREKDTLDREPLIPFTPDFVDYIYSISMGEPRATISYCGHVITAGIALKIPKLDKEFASSVLKDKGLIE